MWIHVLTCTPVLVNIMAYWLLPQVPIVIVHLCYLPFSLSPPLAWPCYISCSTPPFLILACSCPPILACFLLKKALCCIMGESPKFAEIIRTRLVAGKLLQHRLVTGFAGWGEDAFHENRSDTVKYKVFASTWNVGGMAPPDDLHLEDWLDTKANSYDIYVLGFQEIVPLNTRNVIGPKNSSISMKWNELIGEALNKTRRRHQEEEEAEMQQEHEQFGCVTSKQMVGVFVSVWARSGVLRRVRHAAASCVGAGVLGRLGNKGAVSVRFLLHGTSFCFVCCHLASGGKDGDALLRNADAADILSRTSFPRAGGGGGSPEELPKRILDHDRVVLLGDLNYRIAMDGGEAQQLVTARKWGMLLENDELLLELSAGRCFDGWREGFVTFSPTYKYRRNSDDLHWCLDGGRHKQKRAPAWCDRILWRGKGLRQLRYERCGGYRLSDHRPVRAVFDAVCEVNGAVDDSFLDGFFALK